MPSLWSLKEKGKKCSHLYKILYLQRSKACRLQFDDLFMQNIFPNNLLDLAINLNKIQVVREFLL